MSSDVPESRSEKKERTRRAILDAALRLAEDTGLAGLSLRQVAKDVGLVPTAFYRHFDSIDQLGLILAEESFASLRAMIRAIFVGSPSLGESVDRSVAVLTEYVRTERAHFGFIAREKSGGSTLVRAATRRELAFFESELATDLARLLPSDRWAVEDLRILANLIVTAAMTTAEEMVLANPRDLPDITHRARTQFRMVLAGALNWQSQA